ncbi:fluoride efflux transporter FluC [Macrococcoides caseolyticum]|uniref:fluoride efflux transporter FluC n=1 Tax=Macrococcoides caseolyticum TaxID=69966 RepID=UPI000C31E229|nr:CrcB family protein [Macrococcus caseolyticus]PKE63285.1 hypothetical protein CW683_06165 [Macrococcus caseolyticus]PKF45484.1 hypothetical protein CW664_05545 [Macrococcus caseolyticus]TDM14816.1 CrcB family protein [Macrococcus caseolyticus]STY75114.1 camphor resistance protein CrcB [Macrococcus caseolyticus]VUC72601.1 camphor resistance protein CrcB [Macrococcus caseolyticus]
MLFIMMSMLGAASRYGLSLIFENIWATLIVNVIGAFLMGYSSTALKTRLQPHHYKAITTGFLGSFTTFSTMSKETYVLLSTGAYRMLILYLVLTIIGGFLLCLLGVKAGAR